MSYITKLATAVFILAIGAVAGCKSNQTADTTVKDGEIVNTTMGSGGYRFQMPAGYEMVDLQSDDLKLRNTIQLYKQVLTKCKAVPYTGHYESFLLSNGSTAIMFSMEFYQDGSLRGLDSEELQKVMNEVLIRWRYDKEHAPRIETIGGKKVAYLFTELENNFVDNQYVVLSDSDEIFRFITISSSDLSAAAQASATEIIQSLKY